MLLEVQSISKACVALGSTWWVNAAIISGVLCMVLLANALAIRFPRLPLQLIYGLLFASCLGLYFVDLSWFAGFSHPVRTVIVAAVTTLPLLFSGLLFARSFATVIGKDLALGANLLGALVGALLQTIAFISGIKALLLIVAGLYACAMFTQPVTIAQAEPETEPESEPVTESIPPDRLMGVN